MSNVEVIDIRLLRALWQPVGCEIWGNIVPLDVFDLAWRNKCPFLDSSMHGGLRVCAHTRVCVRSTCLRASVYVRGWV